MLACFLEMSQLKNKINKNKTNTLVTSCPWGVNFDLQTSSRLALYEESWVVWYVSRFEQDYLIVGDITNQWV